LTLERLESLYRANMLR